MYKRRLKKTPFRDPAHPHSSASQIGASFLKPTRDSSTKLLNSTTLTQNVPSPGNSGTFTELRQENKKSANIAKELPKSKKRITERNDLDTCEGQVAKMFSVNLPNRRPYFEEILTSCGFEVSHNDVHMLSCDQGIFVRDLKQKIENSSCVSSMVSGFLKSFEEYCENVDNFKKSLQFTKPVENSKAHKTSQDSLIHLLLSVDHLQKRLFEYLCEKLVTLVCASDRNDIKLRDYPWTQMILKQFKFLDHIIDPDGFLKMLFDVLESIPEKGDVLLSLPDIIQDSQHMDTAQMLSDLLLQNSEMTEITPYILDALTYLTLSPEMQRSVSENVMKWLGAVPLDHLPNMVRFLVTNTCPEDIPKVVGRFRRHLDFSSWDDLTEASTVELCEQKAGAGGGPVGTKNCVVLTVEVLRMSVMSSQAMAETWLSAIKAVCSSSDHMPLDVVMLLVLHGCVPKTKAVVQALFRAKAKSMLFREKLLHETFQAMLEVIKLYRSTLMEILVCLLRSPDPSVVHHASCWYKLCLLHLPAWQGQEVVHRLLLHIGAGNHSCKRAALQILMGLAQGHLPCLLPHQRHLQILLDQIPYADLEVAEMILEVLCRVAFGTDSGGSTLNDNLLMLVRKQLCQWNLEARQKGVVGAILAAKHMASKEREEADGNSADDTIKQAVQLMELLTASTNAYPDTTGLFLDKLSSVLSKIEDMDENFLSWIIDYIGQSFEEKYVIPVKSLNLGEDVELMMGLDDPEEADDEDVCIPIAHLVDRDSFKERSQYSPISVMHSSLRLVRCVKYLACDGSLNDIAALLTCPVVMPCAMKSEVGVLEAACPQDQNFLLDSLFHCINWLRELVSAFAYQKNLDIRRAVIGRVGDIVRLEATLSKWLSEAIEYIPPQCQFYDVAKLPKLMKAKKTGKRKGVKRKGKLPKGKKKARSSDVSEAVEDKEQEEEDQEEVGGGRRAVDLSDYRGFLRELDVDVLVLVMEPLQVPSSQAPSSCRGLSPEVLLFLLKDFNAKVEHLLAPEAKRVSALKTANMKPLGFHHLDTFAPRSFACNTVKILPALCDKLQSIAKYCQNLLDESDNIRDAPSMFPENSAEMKQCFTYILSIMAGLFHWSGFESKLNADYLREALRAVGRVRFAPGEEVGERGGDGEGTVRAAAAAIAHCAPRALALPAACALVRVLTALCALSMNEALSEHIAKTCKGFLSQRWYDLKGSEEKGSEFNQQVDFLIKELFNNVPKLKTVSNMVTVVYQEVESCCKLGNKDYSLETYPTITKGNFPLLFRALCAALAQGTDEALQAAEDGGGAAFKVWEVAVDCLRGLMLLARLHHARSNLVAFVKHALRLLRLFLRRGIPLCARLFKSRPAEVTALLQALQKSTRFLNSVCYHSKVTKDQALTSQVPFLRLVLEQIVVDVRVMLSNNNCRDAFWVGVLKNRTLQGEEVLSQESAAAKEEEGPEQELPSDDDSDVDVDLGKPPGEGNRDGVKEDEDDEGSSMSEVF